MTSTSRRGRRGDEAGPARPARTARRRGGRPGPAGGKGRSTRPADTGVVSRARALRRRWIAVLSVLTVLGLAYVLLFTSLLGVRSVEVTGNRDVGADRVREVAEVPERRAMLRVDTDAIAERVADIPGVATVDVSRSWPSTIEIAVTERTPAGVYDTGPKLYLVDAGGVVYKEISKRPQGLPEFRLSEVGARNPETRAVVSVRKALPRQLRDKVTEWRADSPGSVEFTLRSGKTVRWGDASGSDRKAKVLGALMTRKGKVYDVSSPELPTVS
ncbi:cell division protein FtsQ [Prauserella isguenensis]|uniref:Cell division protein FtsQ n=1 Tax=Prauserella isguenensis TaxID=1470180 RepID=A0A839S5P0_9PSEU|nr:FtsQ-type POTRA domain-containing protein [Prauserella isguenensis]MBB3052684.1 cell division protein FtsQ [Prauserella isguenensis]